jgi:hypothetical protein
VEKHYGSGNKEIRYVTVEVENTTSRETKKYVNYDTIDVENWLKCKQNTNHADT